jgi:hypothetical protein
MQNVFGSGQLVGTANTDAYGNALAAPTPVQFGVLQNVSLDASFDVKELYGQNQFAIAVGRGKGKITGKASYAQINGMMMNSLFFGQTLTSGIISDVLNPAAAAIPGTPFQITPTVPNSGTWLNDLGVTDTTGVPYTRVVSGPTTGQYSVSAGVYTFATADTAKNVVISFQYTAASTTAKKMVIANVPMGYAPTFRMDFFVAFQGKQLIVSAGAALSTKLALATKLDDFMLPDFEFSIFADSSGNLLTIGTAE